MAGCGDGQDGGQAQAQAAPPPPSVAVAQPLVKRIVEDDEFVGRFAAVDAVELRARVGGYLQTIEFQDGQIVQQGDLLFTVDPRPFEAALQQTRAELDSARAEVELAKSSLERAEQLVQRGNISRQALDERREAYQAGLARVAASQAAQEGARLDLEYTQIRAPLTGRIDRNFLSIGNLVEENATVLTRIVSTDPMYFYFDIDERSYLAYARDARARGDNLQLGNGGLAVVVHLSDGREAPFTGTLDFSENQLDPNSGTMRVRAVVPDPDMRLTPGLFGRVNVPGSLPYEGVLLPDAAVASDQNRRIVYLVDEAGTVSAREVDPGPRIDGYRVIRAGLTGSEQVVVNGLMRVRPGATVTPQVVELPPVAE